jgi:mRNA-degrading endonuclease HigB of HigAB toxin-antitoxin module
VLNVIGRISDIGNHNNWLFAYYELIAADRISITLAKSVYSFVDTESDQTINAQTRRDANFLYKFESVDPGITLACIKKIFDKRDSSPNTVRSYFRHILNEHNNSPEELTSKFSNDIELLEDIYIWLENNVHYNDYRASFMIAIYKQSHRILEKFVRPKILCDCLYIAIIKLAR